MYKAMIDLSANQLDRFNFSPLIVAISSTYLRKKKSTRFYIFFYFFCCRTQLQCAVAMYNVLSTYVFLFIPEMTDILIHTQLNDNSKQTVVPCTPGPGRLA